MKANRVQTCLIFGFTRKQFDALMLEGFPAEKTGGTRGSDWSINTIEGHRWLVERAVREAGLAAGLVAERDGKVFDLTDERARLAKEQADKLERERKLDEGRLMAAEVVREALLRCFASVNTKLGSMPNRLAHILRPDDPHVARRHLELAVEEMRAELRAIDVRGVAVREGDARH